jgi:hypothetical protein
VGAGWGTRQRLLALERVSVTPRKRSKGASPGRTRRWLRKKEGNAERAGGATEATRRDDSRTEDVVQASEMNCPCAILRFHPSSCTSESKHQQRYGCPAIGSYMQALMHEYILDHVVHLVVLRAPY